MSSLPPPSSDPSRDPAAEPPPLGMVTCEVTGKHVPEDETVVFQGRRVSAEGKQILVDRLNAGETMPGELEDASRLARFGGSFLDGIILGVAAFFIGLIAGFGAVAIGGDALVPRATALGAILGGLLQLAYYGLLHARDGQTVGKMAAKTRVVRVDGGKISAGTAWARSAIFTLPNTIPQIPMLILGLAAAGATITAILQIVFGLFVLVNILAIFRASKRCLHDDFTGTRVVTTRA